MIKRTMAQALKEYAKGYPAVAILGPRQSGKTTLAKATFSKHVYISLENINQRAFAQDDPEKFLKTNENPHGLILDEIQHVPELLSYIQTHIDTYDRPGYFVLTGSQNFIVHQSITQTLAGRIAILTLLPLSIQELSQSDHLPATVEELIIKGGYPRIYQKNLDPKPYYLNYISTYIERDVRQITRVIDLATFERFLKLCAGRVGQLVNLSSLASEAGITHNTVKSWLSILQASYIIFLLQPYYKNFSKRLVKSPKLYFYDTGLASALLNLSDPKRLTFDPMFGALFESLMISELYKTAFNKGQSPSIYFWRDSHGREIDCIIEKGTHLLPIEIKAGQTITRGFFSTLNWWNELTHSNPENSYLIYGGDQNQERSQANVIAWRSVSDIEGS